MKSLFHKRIIKIGLCLAISLVLIAAAGAGAFYWRFDSNRMLSIHYSQPISDADARLQDIDYLSNLPEADYSFSPDEKTRFKTFIEEFKKRSGDLDDIEFTMGVARAVAISENAHTLAIPFSKANSLPIRFFWFEEGMYIVRARAEYASLIGSRVIAYEGHKPEQLIELLDPYHSGNGDLLQYQSVYYLASANIMKAIGIANSPNQILLDLEDSNGIHQTIKLKVEDDKTSINLFSDTHNLLLPQALKPEIKSGHDWRYLNVSIGRNANFVRNPELQHWHEALPNGGLYMSVRSFGASLKNLLSSVVGELSDNPANYIVIDFRSNSGGDYLRMVTFLRKLFSYITDDGKVYILTNGGTFSAAIVSTAFALDSAEGRGVIVGSHVGDETQFWAEGPLIRLPNSGIPILISTGYHDWKNGCNDWSICFWPNMFFDVSVGSFEPNIIVPIKFSDFSQGIDSAMQAVFKAERVILN